MNAAILGLLAALLLNAAPPQDTLEMRFRALDEQRRPLAGATVFASIWSRKDGGNRDHTTGADGVAVVRRPRQVQLLRVWVSKPGYAGLFRGWEQGTHDEGRNLPAAFDFSLPKATTVGGRIVDAQGRGISGARIEASCGVEKAKTLPDGITYNNTLAWGAGAAVTDNDGRWQLANVPAPATSFSLRITHLDFVSDTEYGGLQKANRVTTAQLRAGEAVVRLAPGARIQGTVTDAAGKPVARAVVVFHDEPYLTPGSQEVLTDAQGKYLLPTLPPGRHPIIVVAEGHMPQRREVDAAVGSRQEDFRLEPGQRLRVQVIDEDGKPVRAYFAIRSWRGRSSLYNTRHPNVLNTNIPTATNAEGVFEWSWAPADAVKYFVTAEGFVWNDFDLTASGDVQTVTLKRLFTVAGRVTDARTGKPVERFRVSPVLEFGPTNLSVNRARMVMGSTGAYRLVFDRGDVDLRLLVEADGYRTAMSRPALVAGKVKQVDFALEPAEPVRGRVLGAGGVPVVGARVSLATTVQDYRSMYEDHNLFAFTDKAGVFTLPAQAQRYVLFASHDQGCAQVDCRHDQPAGDLTLRPWVSVRGTLWQDGKPVPEQTVFVRPLARNEADAPRLWFDYQMQTDADGAFSFRRMPAGPLTVSAYLGPWQPSPLTSSESVALDPKPGTEVRLDLGKSGATVLGTIKLEGNVPKGLDLTYSVNWLTRQTPDVSLPAGWNPSGIDLRGDGRPTLGHDEYLQAYRRFYVKPTPGGSFKVVGVPAGEYWLSILVYEKPDG